MKVLVFNVQHGFCSFIISPNGYGLMIDCGAREDFSPVKYTRQIGIITPYVRKNGRWPRKIAKFVLTHPHADHLNDIGELVRKREQEPGIVQRCKHVLTKIQPQPSTSTQNPRERKSLENLNKYLKWQERYSQDAEEPNWGFKLFHKSLTKSQVEEVSSEDNEYVNNTSIVTVIEHNDVKFLFPGDLQVSGWEKLLEDERFVEAASGTNFFITSHHGHKNGFTKKIIDVLGKPDLFVIPARSGDDDVDSSYSKSEFSNGFLIEGDNEKSHSVSTKDKNTSIFVEVEDEAIVQRISIPPNILSFQRATRKKIAQRRAKQLISI